MNPELDLILMHDTKEPRILVIDDDIDLLKAMDLLLQANGCSTFCTDSADAGIEYAKNHDLDLIILDVMMPDTDGWETHRRLREEVNYTKHVVFYSASMDAETRFTKEGLNGTSFVFKPLIAKRISQIIRQHTSRGITA